MRVKATIQVNGRPLRRAYVEHLVAGVGTGMYMTDLEGRIRDANFDEGIDSLTPNADIRVICQNPILRVKDGDNALIGVYQDRAITGGSIENLNTNAEQDDYFAILNRAEITYEVVFRPLRFFRELPNADFPLGRGSNLRSTRDQAKRIDLVYPDHSVSTLAWVEPKRLGDDFPLMHIKHRTVDGRLFGEAGQAPTLIPHEMAHAMHFSFLSKSQRGTAQDKYAQFILTSPITLVGPFHDFNLPTTPEVAYIEAGGAFSERFMEFMRARQGSNSTLVRPETITPAIHAEFVQQQWNQVTRARNLPPPPPIRPRFGTVQAPAVATLPALNLPITSTRFARLPTVTGGDVEGAVYSAIFVDFAATVGLDFAASSYFAANAITFGEYREYIHNQHPQHDNALEAARVFWGL